MIAVCTMTSVPVVRTYPIVREKTFVIDLSLNNVLGIDKWSSGLVNLSDLKDDAVGYLVKIGVIARSNQVSYEISESDLILNRLARYIDVEKPFLKICT